MTIMSNWALILDGNAYVWMFPEFKIAKQVLSCWLGQSFTRSISQIFCQQNTMSSTTFYFYHKLFYSFTSFNIQWQSWEKQFWWKSFNFLMKGGSNFPYFGGITENMGRLFLRQYSTKFSDIQHFLQFFIREFKISWNLV